MENDAAAPGIEWLARHGGCCFDKRLWLATALETEETRGCRVACQLRRGRRKAGSASAATMPVAGIVGEAECRETESRDREKERADGGCLKIRK